VDQEGRVTGQCFDSLIGNTFALYHGDSVLAMPGLPDASVGLSVSSWPFSDQYAYSPSINDFGNCDDDDDFFAQMTYLLPELLRVTIPGRYAIVHCKDRIIYGSRNDGWRHIEPFSDKVTAAMRAAGFLFYGRITVATDPVRENNQTNNLPYSELQKDASRFGVGMPEYLLLFRRPHVKTAEGGQWSDERVALGPDEYSLPRWQLDANSVWRSDGRRSLLPWEDNGYSYAAHVAYLEDLDRRILLGRAHGQPLPTDSPWVWWDISRIAVLNGRVAKESEDEKHICPLQLDLIERCITRWSNRGDVVLDYFAGIGSVPWQALKLGRRGVGIELKRSYYQVAARYLEDLEVQLAQPQLPGFEMVAA
jgi:DNA modification methylase